MRAKGVFEYQRGNDPKKGLRVGKYAPGTVKDFDDVETGDIAKDFSGEEWEVIDKAVMKIDYGANPLNSYFCHVTDPKIVQFLEQYDESGIMTDFLDHSMPEDDESEIQLLAVTDKWTSQIYMYDDSGALVYW